MMPPALHEALRRSYHRLCRPLTHWRRLLATRGPKVIVLLYHRVVPEVGWNSFNTKVSVGVFRQQLEAVARRYPVVPLAGALDGRTAAGTVAVLTFDDGYWDTYAYAWPVLQHLGLPASFFVAPDGIGTDRPLWDWEVALLLNGSAAVTRVGTDGFEIRQGSTEPRHSFILRVLERLKAASRDMLDQVRERLREQVGRAGQPNDAQERCLRWEELAALARSGMEIGSHACSHRSLARLPAAEAELEIRQSRAAIEQRLGLSCRSFAFPFGSPRDYTPGLIDAVRAAGYARCLLNIPGPNSLRPAAFALGRVIMTEATPVRFLLG